MSGSNNPPTILCTNLETLKNNRIQTDSNLTAHQYSNS